MAGRTPAAANRSTRAPGPADYARVSPLDTSSTVDSAARMRAALDDSGLVSQVPAQEAPDVPDPEVFSASRRQSELTGLVHGLTGTVPMTTYGAKIGQKPGTVLGGPAWDAADQSAKDPWEAEKLNVENANKMHAFVNQYAQLKAGVSDKNMQRAFDLSRENAILEGSYGMQDRIMQMQQKYNDLMNKRLDADLAHRQFTEDATSQRLKLMEDANARAAAKTEHSLQPGVTEGERYASATRATEALENVDKLLQVPGITDGFKGATAKIDPQTKLIQITGGRLSGSPEAQQLATNIKIAHHHLLMMDPRQGTRFGASLLADVFPMIGDNPNIARGTMRQLIKGPLMVKQVLKNKYPDYGWEDDTNLYDTLNPLPDDARVKTPDAIDDELNRRGWK